MPSCLLLLFLAGCGEKNAIASGKPGGPDGMKMLVLGMDGLDPKLLKRLMDAGDMPNFKTVAERGEMSTLGTSMPPQSPVAWSNFISGCDPGVHQVYDFIHRDPAPPEPDLNIRLFLSTSEAVLDPRWYHDYLPRAIPIPFTEWRVPTISQRIESYRRGPSFWDYLVTQGVPTTIYRVPANYPPPTEILGKPIDPTFGPKLPFRCLCGMGTPDLSGAYARFTFFDEEQVEPSKVARGGSRVRLDVQDDHARTRIEGPQMAVRRPDANNESPATFIELDIVRDFDSMAALVTLGTTHRLLLKVGEWSDWVHVDLHTDVTGETLLGALGLPTKMPATVRVYLKSLEPLQLYTSSLNIDPTRPVNPISAPANFAAEIAEQCGPYYTQGIPEDTNVLREKLLDESEFLQMVRLLAQERTDQYHAALAGFDRGFLFFYFGHTDQLSHVFWRDTDPGHPGRVPEQNGLYDHVIDDVYREMDVRVGEALAKLDDDDVLIIMSDHGFSSFRRGFNMNTWLADSGFLHVLPGDVPNDNLDFVDWSTTQAYACGINAVYVNLRGREKKGIVTPQRKREVMNAIARGLLEVRDADGTQVITKVYITEDEYAGADPKVAPDLLIGYAENYRGSWSTTLGGIRKRQIEDNKDRWSGDHCIAAFLVPGVFLSNRKLSVDDPALIDMAPSILGCFGIERPAGMRGRNVLAPQ